MSSPSNESSGLHLTARDILHLLQGHCNENERETVLVKKMQEAIQCETSTLNHQLGRANLLVQLGQMLHSSLDLQKLFYRFAGEIKTIVPCDGVLLLLPDWEKQAASGFVISRGETPPWTNLPLQSLQHSLLHWLRDNTCSRGPVDLQQGSLLAEEKWLKDHGFRASLHVPLYCRDKFLGALGLASRQDRELVRIDGELLADITSVLASALDNVNAYREISELKRQLAQENTYLRGEIQGESQNQELIGDSLKMEQVRHQIDQVAGTDSSVLISGETGTGKELVARAIHKGSPRRKHLLVNVNCMSLSANLITSELFGHEVGAFTGAGRRRRGRFELANGGTLFLDEITETPPETQALLLRALQEKVIERVGGSEPIRVDVRIIAATNRDLAREVAEHKFRADLYYRLNVFPIQLPALRERTQDIPLLAGHFLEHYTRKMKKSILSISPRALRLLMDYHWPGNVRELQNLIERAVIISSGLVLEIDPSWFTPNPEFSTVKPGSLANRERQQILEALHRCAGKIYGPAGAAEILGLKPTTLYGKMRKHGIQRSSKGQHFE